MQNNNLHVWGEKKKTMPGRLILVKHLNAETQNTTLKHRHYTPISILCCFLCHVLDISFLALGIFQAVNIFGSQTRCYCSEA